MRRRPRGDALASRKHATRRATEILCGRSAFCVACCADSVACDRRAALLRSGRRRPMWAMSHELRQHARAADPGVRDPRLQVPGDWSAYFGGGTFTNRETIV